MKNDAIRKVKGSFNAKGLRFGLVVSQFNEFLTKQLEEAALDTLLRHGARPHQIFVVHVPGAFEIPLAAERLVRSKKVDAVITLAIVIKGQTKHFEQVVTESARGIQTLIQKSQIPVILGIIPATDKSQVTERLGVKQANKGREWALSAIEMANLMKHPLLNGARAKRSS